MKVGAVMSVSAEPVKVGFSIGATEPAPNLTWVSAGTLDCCALIRAARGGNSLSTRHPPASHEQGGEAWKLGMPCAQGWTFTKTASGPGGADGSSSVWTWDSFPAIATPLLGPESVRAITRAR